MTEPENAKPSRNDDSPSPEKPHLPNTWPKKQRTKSRRALRSNASVPSGSIKRKEKEAAIEKRGEWQAVSRGLRSNGSVPSSSRKLKEKEKPFKKRAVWPPVSSKKYTKRMVKKIRRNDKCNHLFLTKKDVDEYISPFLKDFSYEELVENGRPIAVWDTDINTERRLILKRLNYHHCKTPIFSGRWREDFVKGRGLEIGDEVAFCWDEVTSRFNFSVKKTKQRN